jgi:hypothetical protein
VLIFAQARCRSKWEINNYILRSAYFYPLFGIRKNYNSCRRNLLLRLFVRRRIKLTVVIIKENHCYQLHLNILNNNFLLRLTPYVEEIVEDHQFVFRGNESTTDQIFCIYQILEKNGGQWKSQSAKLVSRKHMTQESNTAQHSY